MVQRDQREGQEGPEDEGMGEAGERELADDFGLAENFPEEVPDALAQREEVEAGISFRFEDFIEDYAEAPPEEVAGGDEHCGKEELLDNGEVLGFGQGWERRKHRQAEQQYRTTIQDGARGCRGG